MKKIFIIALIMMLPNITEAKCSVGGSRGGFSSSRSVSTPRLQHHQKQPQHQQHNSLAFSVNHLAPPKQLPSTRKQLLVKHSSKEGM
jgi:hypothetical protein